MTHEPPLVHVIVVNWNGRDDVLACLASLEAITYANTAITVVDNASEDGSVDAIRARFPAVTIIENDRNEMFARANNQGIERALTADAAFVLLLNNDTEVAPDFLDRMVETARTDGNIGMVAPKIYFFDEPERLWYAGGVVSLARGLIAHVGIRELDAGQYDKTTDTGYATGCAVLVSRKCLEIVGGLDESYRIYGEDADWSERARRAGFRVVYEPRARVWHKVSSSSGGREVAGGLTPFKVRHKIRSMFRFLGRYARWYHWITIPWFLAAGGIRAAILMIGSGNWAGIRALLTAPRRRGG